MNHIKEKEAQEAEAFNIKNKRDQYVYEIRKQKMDNKIREKRVKLTAAFFGENQQAKATANVNNQNQPLTQLEQRTETFQELTREFMRGVAQNDISIVFNAIQTIRHKLSRSDSPPIDEFIETGIFPSLVKLLDEEYKQYFDLQFEVIWVITNAVAGSQEQTAKLIDQKTIETLLKYLWHSNSQLVDQVFWAFGNLSADSQPTRLMLIKFGVLDNIFAFMRANNGYSENLIKSVGWILSNVSTLRESHEKIYQMLPILENLLYQKDDLIISYACWTYYNLTSADNERMIDAILTEKFMKKIILLLESGDMELKRPSIRTVGNILSGKSAHTKKMFEAGCLDKLEALIEHQKPIVRKEVIWAISNVLAESEYIIDKVLEGSVFAKLLNAIILDIPSIKVEALICFINALNTANVEQSESIIRMGLLRVLSQVLSNVNSEIVLAGLELLECILVHGKDVQQEQGLDGNPMLLSLDNEGVVRYIEELQKHQSVDVYNKVIGIIETHFETQDVEQP